MNFGVKFRLVALGLGLGLMGALIIFIMLFSQQQGTELHARLTQLDSESFRMAEHFKDSLRDVSDKLLRYRTLRNEASWMEFTNASDDLAIWINGRKSQLNTESEKNVLKKIDAAYADFRHDTCNLRDQLPPIAGPNLTATNLVDPLSLSRRRLFDLGQDLAQAHYDQRNQLLAHANQTLDHLRWSFWGLFSLLFLFGIALAAMVYRDMIRPLRLQLVESQALVEQNEKLASLGLVAAGVAHEIRNPLTAIKAGLFMQKKKFPAVSPERDQVEMVEREILRLERIVNDFLQFARPGDPQLTTVSPDFLFGELQGLFVSQFEKSNIQLNWEPSGPLHVRADPAQLKQVLINLIKNAADSIGQNGRITLRARVDRKRHGGHGAPETAMAVLEVADTGKGIAPEVQKRLFDPFFSTKDNGTGLGLSIAARIVQKHGGELQFQTQVNCGTTFGIILPRA
jgi:signal transduction histidine kinase